LIVSGRQAQKAVLNGASPGSAPPKEPCDTLAPFHRAPGKWLSVVGDHPPGRKENVAAVEGLREEGRLGQKQVSKIFRNHGEKDP